MKQYVYHFKPQLMQGDELIPLNELQASHPEAHAEQVKKYQGREQLLKEKIPLLDCLWNDVLDLSPIHPQLMIDIWREKDLLKQARLPQHLEVYKIPVDLLQEQNTIYFQSLNFDFYNYDPNLEKFWHFRHEEFREQTAVDAKQLKTWQTESKAGRVLLWYSHTIHILTKQRINIHDCELIFCGATPPTTA